MDDEVERCSYAVGIEEYQDWGGFAHNWSAFRDTLGIEGDAWVCPHETVADGDRCPFHTDPADLPDDVDESEAIARACERSLGDEPAAYRYRQFLGATFGSIRIDHEAFETGGDHEYPLAVAGAAIDGSLRVAGPVDYPVYGTYAIVSGDVTFASTRVADRVHFVGATVEGDLDFTEAVVEGRIDFQEASVAGEATFLESSVAGNARFWEATVDGELSAHSAEIDGDLELGKATVRSPIDASAATVGGDVGCWMTTADGDLKLDSASVSGAGDFREATVDGNVSVCWGKLDGEIDFSDARFAGDLDFLQSDLGGPLDFEGASVEGDVVLTRATVSEEAEFGPAVGAESVSVDGDLSLINGTVDGSVEVTGEIGGGLHLGEVTVRGTVSGAASEVGERLGLGGATVQGELDLHDAAVGGSLSLAEATVAGRTDGSGLAVEDRAEFERTTFEGRADFGRATFRDDVSFEGAILRNGGSFEGAAFRADADFGDLAAHEGLDCSGDDKSDGGRETTASAVSFARPPDFSGATCPGADFAGTDLDGADFRGATASDATFTGTTLSRATLADCDVSHADLVGADLTEVRANGADFQRADCSGADFSGASLERAHLTGAELLGADLSGAAIYAARVGDATIDADTTFDRHGEHRCVYDPASAYGLEDHAAAGDVDGSRETRLRKATGTYQALEQLTRLNAFPDEYATFFVRRQDTRRERLRITEEFPRLDYWFAVVQRAVFTYGESFSRVVAWSVGTILFFALVYPLGGWLRTTSPAGEPGLRLTYARIAADPVLLWDSLHQSTLVFLTGGGPHRTVGFVGELLATVEALVGPTLLALLVFVLGRRAAR